MKVNVISRKLIKPRDPTPSHLSVHKISVLDELNTQMHVIRILYYYPSHGAVDAIALEEPLARVLPLFYPLAGRYNKEMHQVDCNDDGAEYCVAEIDCQMHQLVGGPVVESGQLNSLLPIDVCAADEPTDPMLAVQINRFKCGGLAIGVCASHRIFDALSLAIFLTAWSNAATTASGTPIIRPDFSSSSHFPSQNLPPKFPHTKTTNIVTKRLVFDKNAIFKLRERLTGTARWTSAHPPSRVLVVSALLAQALVRADRARHGSPRATLIVQPINMRERTVPPLPKHCCGSLISKSYVELTGGQSLGAEGDLVGTALKLRETVVKGVKDCGRLLSDRKFGQQVLVDTPIDAIRKTNDPDYKVIMITDWSKFGEYEVDFGFGKPVWVSLADVPIRDLCILTSSGDYHGIEAWVYLDELDVPFFEQDEDLRMLTITTSHTVMELN